MSPSTLRLNFTGSVARAVCEKLACSKRTLRSLGMTRQRNGRWRVQAVVQTGPRWELREFTVAAAALGRVVAKDLREVKRR